FCWRENVSCLGRFSCSLAGQTPYSVNQHLSLAGQTPYSDNQSLSLAGQTPYSDNQSLSLAGQTPYSDNQLFLLAGQTKITLIFTSFSYLYIDMFLHIDHTPHQNHDNE